jgi:hypothetical protein
MLDTETEKALLGVIPVLAGVLATGLVGSGLGYWWNVQLKRREADLTTIRAFHDLYGEFFAVWKLWNYYVEDIGPEHFPDASRWKLLERACAAEGRMEAILIDLSSKYHSDRSSLEKLGRFRQVYQQLRETIRSNKALNWNWSEHPTYMAFKCLAPVVAYMTRGRRKDDHFYDTQIEAWLYVTDNRHERFWDKEDMRPTSRSAPFRHS